MGNKVYNLSTSDFVFGTVIAGGRTLATLAGNGYATIEEVVRELRQAAGLFVGLASIIIRNRTQGWQVEQPVARAAKRLRRA